jgi:ribosome recycling factor
MEEEVQLVIDLAEEKMSNAISHLDSELTKIRAGKASPNMLEGIYVDYYGTRTPLNQVSNIGTPDAKTLAIQPWEKTMIEPIEKAIMAANIGLTPANNGEIIRINIPALTEERRIELVKKVKNECEDARISVRNARREANDELKKLQKSGLSEDNAKDKELEIQKLTDNYIEKVEELLEKKEKDIMTV